jgi:glucokinase
VYASGSAFIRRFESALAQQEATVLLEWTKGDPSRLTAAHVARAAAEGDAFAQRLWGDATKWLGVACANYVTLLNPERLVLGGGVVDAVPSIVETVVRSIQANSTILSRQTVQVVRAELGDWAGAVGAASLAHLVTHRTHYPPS